MNTRRRLVIALGACASVPGSVFAQPKKPPGVIGWLNTGLREASGDNLAEFKKKLATLGWQEGLFLAERQRIVQFALSQRWPVVGGAALAAAGALLSYSADASALYRALRIMSIGS